MKIRIKGNSIRIRLSRPEVDRFGKDGYLEEHTEFGNSVFTYVLQSRPDAATLSATFVNNRITVIVPVAIATEWATNENVGYDHNMDTGNGKQLYLLIEKDFVCIDAPPGEDQSDKFENPNKVC